MRGEWVVIALTSRGEVEDPDLVDESLRAVLGKDAEIFLPAIVTTSGEDRRYEWILPGYVFVRRVADDAKYLKLENARYVSSVLVKGREIGTVPDSQIQSMRRQVVAAAHQGIGVGDTVQITNGSYKQIVGTVVADIPEDDAVQVYVSLRSKQTLVTLPRSFTKLVTRSPFSPLFARVAVLKSWIRAAQPILELDDVRMDRLEALMASYHRAVVWSTKGSRLFSLIRFALFDFTPRFDEIDSKLARLQYVASLCRQVEPRLNFLRFHYQDPVKDRLALLEAKTLELAWLDSVQGRIRSIQREMAVLKKKVKGNVDYVQNVVVDGHNLAFRCLFAPGMGALADSKGRPTGMILGFLRSLGALKKRCPEARLIVTWDGSSQRRKNRCPHYKSNRANHLSSNSKEFDQFSFIRGLLPKLGVDQVWNPEEEADDVVATLVRGDLKDQFNLMFSTDRDLLQLVTEKTHFLVPAIGSRREKYFDNSDAVIKEMGVPPEQVIHFRAFSGDTSDQIPGVPRVPKRVLLGLVRQHGTVDGVYKSSLAGTTKAQYERLQREEARVRLNLELMTLLEVPLTWTSADLDTDAAAECLRDINSDPDNWIETFRLRM